MPKSTNSAIGEIGDTVAQEGHAIDPATDAAKEEEYDGHVAKMEEAVAEGNLGAEQIASAPPLLKDVQAVVETSTSIIDNVQSAAELWGPVLDKLRLFTLMVDKIADVRNRNIMNYPAAMFDTHFS